MDTIQRALALVTRAKAYHAQDDVCWHGRPGGIQGYDSQYGLPVDCYGCESMDSNEPPYEPAEIYAWALDIARGETKGRVSSQPLYTSPCYVEDDYY